MASRLLCVIIYTVLKWFKKKKSLSKIWPRLRSHFRWVEIWPYNVDSGAFLLPASRPYFHSRASLKTQFWLYVDSEAIIKIWLRFQLWLRSQGKNIILTQNLSMIQDLTSIMADSLKIGESFGNLTIVYKWDMYDYWPLGLRHFWISNFQIGCRSIEINIIICECNIVKLENSSLIIWLCCLHSCDFSFKHHIF